MPGFRKEESKHLKGFKETTFCRFPLWSVTETRKLATTFCLFSTWRWLSNHTGNNTTGIGGRAFAIRIIGHNVSNKSSYQAVSSRSFIPDIFRNCAPKELLMTKGKQDWEFMSGAVTCKKNITKNVIQIHVRLFLVLWKISWKWFWI